MKQVFRSQVVTGEFMKNFSKLMAHVKSIEIGETHIESASGLSPHISLQGRVNQYILVSAHILACLCMCA